MLPSESGMYGDITKYRLFFESGIFDTVSSLFGPDGEWAIILKGTILIIDFFLNINVMFGFYELNASRNMKRDLFICAIGLAT